MSSRRRLAGLSAGCLLALSACSGPTVPMPDETVASEPNARTHWVMRHRVTAGPGIEVVTQTLADQHESTGAAVANKTTKQRDDCYVSLSNPDQGGPGNMVGEKIETTFDGHPAVRNGAGAEADYLMWQLTDRSWVLVSCSDENSRASIDRLAGAVKFTPTTIPVPVDFDVPRSVRLSSVSVDLANSSAQIYLNAFRTGDRGDLSITVGHPEETPNPDGRSTTIAGHPAVVFDGKISPMVWVQEQGRWVRVAAATSDTGPYPDRSGELPAVRALAESLTFARDLSDPTTWFPAEDVFG
ncbi:MAG: hypothetical protein QM650_08655 [Microlunatus sp.]